MTKQEALISILGLFVVNVVARALPHAANFAPVTASGLFLGAYVGRRASLCLMLAILLISDYALLYVNPYGHVHLTSIYAPWHLWYGNTQLFVYGSFGISALAGAWLRSSRTVAGTASVALFCSLQFFFITNAAVWINGAYDRGIHGLYEAYVAGIPFFKGTVAGDLFYTMTFFGLFDLVRAQRTPPMAAEHELSAGAG
jgi:uncharacterized protein DUF6580